MKTPAIIAAIAFLCAVAFLFVARSSGGAELETRTFELHYMNPHLAAEVIEPYVYTDCPDASGQISSANNLLTVRETADNLEKIGRVLEQYDVPPSNVQLHFQIIAANGATTTDSSIADVDLLRRLFRFQGYRLMGQAMLSGLEGSRIGQVIGSAPGDPPLWEGGGHPYFHIGAGIESVRGDGDSGTIRLDVTLGTPGAGDIIETSVNVRAGQTVVLGSAQPMPSSETIILTVRPEIVRP